MFESKVGTNLVPDVSITLTETMWIDVGLGSRNLKWKFVCTVTIWITEIRIPETVKKSGLLHVRILDSKMGQNSLGFEC